MTRVCERCGTPVIKKELVQWFFRTTDYAEELRDFSQIDWPERVQTLQTNWIGRSEGASVVFQTEQGDPLEVFTTRPDTLWGATFMVIAPEHPLVDKLATPETRATVESYIREAVRQTDIQREATDKEKSGVFTGGYAINPVNDERIPIWIADYVLMTYGTGAIMAVPAHDERDFEFALKFGLPILPVIDRPDGLTKSYTRAGSWMKAGFTEALQAALISFEREGEEVFVTFTAEKIDDYIKIAQDHLQPNAWVEIVGSGWKFIFADEVMDWDSTAADAEILTRCKRLEPDVQGFRTLMEMLWSQEFYRPALSHHDYGTMINSQMMTGTPGDRAFDETIVHLEERGVGKRAINYRLRDWLISRQRYWGAPIPMIYCDECGVVPVPEDQLPVLLPDDVEWLPTGEIPLKAATLPGNVQPVPSAGDQPNVKQTQWIPSCVPRGITCGI